MKGFRVWDSICKCYIKDNTYLDNDGFLYKFDEHQCLKILLPSFYIVEHYTGRDDKNGVKIFEGDIINVEYNFIGRVVVKFEKGKFNISDYNISKCSVVENIHES